MNLTFYNILLKNKKSINLLKKEVYEDDTTLTNLRAANAPSFFVCVTEVTLIYSFLLTSFFNQ